MGTNLSDFKEEESILNVIDRLNYAAYLVEYLGGYKLANGKTIAETLTIGGISFWDIFSAEFAHIHFPQILLSDPVSQNLWYRIKPGLIRFKYKLNNFIRNKYNIHGCLNWPQGNTVLCLAFTNRMYIDIIHPIVDRLVNQKDVNVMVMLDKDLPSIKHLTVEGSGYQKIWQHWESRMAEDVSIFNSAIEDIKLNLELPNILLDILGEKHLYLIPNFNELFNRFFHAYLPLIVPYVVVAKHILQEHRPAMLLTPDTADSRIRVFSFLCKKMKIPCLDIQFGLAGDEAVEWRFLLANFVAVWGNSSKEAMLKQKIKEDRIIVTGSPRHDTLINTNNSDLYAKRELLSIPKKNAVILLASTYHFKSKNHADVNILRSMQTAISNAATKTPNISLIVKPHPHENVRETRKIFNKSKNIIFVERDSDIRELIKICNAFISYGSTATIDALIAGNLTICPIFPGWLFSSDIFKDSGATLVPETSEEIDNIFSSISDGTYVKTKASLEPARKNFLNNYIFGADGKACDRIEALILRMSCINKST